MNCIKNILLIICLSSKLIFAQTASELGLPTITNFFPSDFNGTKGIFDISQNENGLMYFANFNSILEFDGSKWRSYNMPNNGITYSYSLGDKKRIYVGTDNDLGFFEPNEVGALEFFSLKKHLPENLKNFIKTSNSGYVNGKVYFEIMPTIGNLILYAWDTNAQTMEQIELAEKWLQLFPLNDLLYISVNNVGLGKLENNQFSLLKNGELLKDKNITAINSFPDEPENLLITTVNNGLFIYNMNDFTLNKWQINYNFEEEFAYKTLMLPDKNVLIGTLNSGALIFNLSGELIYSFNKTNGILNNAIYSTFIDNSGGLWLGGSLGISHIDFSAPIKWLDNRSELKGDDFYVTRHRNSLYISNYSGNIFKLSQDSNQFENISIPGVITGELFKTKDELFYESDNEYGLLVEKDGEFKSVIQKPVQNYATAKIFHLIASSYEPGRYFIGTYRGLKVIRKENDQWIDEGLIGDDKTQIYKLIEDIDGSLWALTYTHLSRIKFGHGENGALNLTDYNIDVFDESHGFKTHDKPTPLNFNGKTVFATGESIYHFDESNQRFSRDSTSTLSKHLKEFPIAENDTKILSQDFQDNFWLYTNARRSLSLGIPDNNGNIEWITDPFNRIAGLGASNPFKDENNTLWFSTYKGLLQFDLNKALNPGPEYPALIRKVTTNDSMVFNGGTPSTDAKKPMAYANNKIRIEFSASSYSESKHILFSTFLEGSSKNWTNNSSETFKEFTNLSPGKYTFWVKAINTDGKESTSASFSFEILSPWWNTWWAYILFAASGISIIFLLIRWRTASLQKEKEKLESQVIKRTKELQHSIENLKSTQSQLIQSEKMASLGELTAGIAHEIQNPLNFVNNFSEVSSELLDEMNEELDKGDIEEAKSISADIKQNLEKINHHGKRADGIVKGMLQHSRSSSSVKELTDINKLTDEYLRLAYHGLRAKDKTFNATIKTNFDESLENIEVVPQDIGRVILNLITNAFYACTERSRSAVTEKKNQQSENYEPTVIVSTKKSSNTVMITVEDNGNGIPHAIVDKIFQPFFTTKPTGQGTGLGLSLSYDIVKAHGGALKVETKSNDNLSEQTEVTTGTKFIIQLPLK